MIFKHISSLDHNYLYENKKGFKIGCRFEHETCVLSEPFYISFISRVDENWSILVSTTPEGVVDQIPLLKGMIALRIEIEVVKYLREVHCFVKLVFGCKLRELLRPNE